MKLTQDRREGSDIVRVQGRLDASTSPDMQDRVLAMLDGSGPLVMDLSGVHYVSSAGLRALLILLKECSAQGRRFALTGLTPDVHDVIRLTGFDKILEIHPDVDAALAANV
ncbi:MAG: STAS domain-containing protein [Pseudomonadota bacterium]